MTHFAAHIDTAPLEEIISLCTFLRGRFKGVKIYQMVQRAVNQKKHPLAVLEVLRRFKHNIEYGLPIRSPWGLWNNLIVKYHQNYNERDTVRAWDDLKVSIGECSPEVQEIAGKLFGAVSG